MTAVLTTIVCETVVIAIVPVCDSDGQVMYTCSRVLSVISNLRRSHWPGWHHYSVLTPTVVA